MFHCPKCTTTATGTGDFLCDTCDLEVHRHVKRRNHIRTQIPDVTAREAVHKIMGCFKYLLARKVLVAKCRLEFQRFFDPPTKTYFYFRPSIQVFNRRPMYFLRVAAMAYAPVRSVGRPRRRERGRDAWRRSRSLAPHPRPSLPRSRPRSPLQSLRPLGTRIAAVREKHAIAERDKANTQNQRRRRPGASPSASRRRSSAPTRPSTTTSSGSRRGRRVRGAFTRVDGVGWTPWRVDGVEADEGAERVVDRGT